MASYLDEYRKVPISYLVYYYKGEIKVQRGHDNYGIFVVDDENRSYAKTPKRHYQVSSCGKIIVDREEDIPKAKEMLIEHYKNKLDSIKRQKDIAISNIEKL